MKRRCQTLPALLIAFVIFGGLCACSDSENAERISQGESLDTEQAGLDKMSSVESLKQALAWAKGKSPEAMAAEVSKDGWEDYNQELYWRYYITQVAFIDQYGEEKGSERMQEVLNELRSNQMSERHHRQRNYIGDLGRDYPEIYEIALEDPERALSKLGTMLIHPTELEELQSEVIIAYGQSNPAEALAFLETKENIVTYSARRSIVLAWAREDPEAALNYVDTLNEKRSMMGLRGQLLEEMVDYDPIRALEAAVNSPITRQTDSTLKEVAERYVERNPEAGFEWLMQQEALSSILLEAGVYGLASKNPELADALMKSVDPERWSSKFIGRIAAGKAKQDMARAMEWADQLPWPSYRLTAYRTMISAMARDHPDQFATNLNSIENLGIPADSLSDIMEDYAQRHPEAAMQWAMSASDSPAAALMFGEAGRQLIRKDPGRIREMLSVLDSGAHRSEAISEIIAGWMDAAPDQTINWVRNEATQSQLDSIIPKISSKWLNQDMKAALDFAKELPPSEARYSILNRYVYNEAERNLNDVVVLISSVERSEKVDSLLRKAFERGSDVRPEAAKALALSIKDPESRDQAIYGTTWALLKIDPAMAADWVGKVDFANDENLRKAMVHVVDRYDRNDTEAMTNWALGLTDAKKRHNAALRAVLKVKKDDPATASRLINSAQPGKKRGDIVMSVLRELPDKNARDSFLGSVFLSKEEQEQVREARERRGL